MRIAISTDWYTDYLTGYDQPDQDTVRYVVVSHDLPIPRSCPGYPMERLTRVTAAQRHRGHYMPAVAAWSGFEENLGHIILTEDEATPEAIEQATTRVMANALALRGKWYEECREELTGRAEAHAESIRCGYRESVYLDEHDGVEADGEIVIAYMDDPFVEGDLLEVEVGI